MEIQFDANYKEWLRSLKEEYRKSQIKAAVKVNSELIRFYYRLGKEITERQFDAAYGSGFYKRLSTDLAKEIPNATGFSVTSLKSMSYFYRRYSVLKKNLQQVADDFESFENRNNVLQRHAPKFLKVGKKVQEKMPLQNA